MNYNKIYQQLVLNRQSRIITEGVYYEEHHIIPKSEGGNNKVSNLVKLTPREHYIAHLLLWKAQPNNMRRYWPLQWFYDKDGVRIPSRIIQMIKEDRSKFVNLRNYDWAQDPDFRYKASLTTRNHTKDFSYRQESKYKENMQKHTKRIHNLGSTNVPTKNKKDGRFEKLIIIVDDMVYESLSAAAKSYNISVKAAYNRVKKDTWPNWRRN